MRNHLYLAGRPPTPERAIRHDTSVMLFAQEFRLAILLSSWGLRRRLYGRLAAAILYALYTEGPPIPFRPASDK